MSRGTLLVVAALGIGGLIAGMVIIQSVRTAAQPTPSVMLPKERGADVEVERRAKLDQTVFAKEMEAQRHEGWFYRHWDLARAKKHAFDWIGSLSFSRIRLGVQTGGETHDWGVSLTKWAARPEHPALDQAGWKAALAAWEAAGYQVVESEWHQPLFDYLESRQAYSHINFIVHAINTKDDRRIVIKGKIQVTWREPAKPAGIAPEAAPVADAVPRPPPFGNGRSVLPEDVPPVKEPVAYTAASIPEPDEITVLDVSVVERAGGPVFAEVTRTGSQAVDMGGPYAFLHPTLIYDVDRDNLPEILIPSDNRIFRNRGGMRFDYEPLCPEKLEVETGVLGDFDGDSLVDMLIVDRHRLKMLRGLPGGKFSPSVQVADLPAIDVGQSLTTADIDGDGDLDALLSQYLEPYRDGQMPTPYYDANDGYPLYLLKNDGRGRFSDATVGSGLEAKRRRRVSVASFVDLNGDVHPDLLLTCDFAGHDLFVNDGKGGFRDVTSEWIDDHHNFGMGHCFADWDGDGNLDLYLIGMSSTTARRLTAMKAGLDEFPEHQNKRPLMGYGNRMFLGQGAGKPYRRAPWMEQVNRTGWSWGGVTPDIDLDGDPDLYVTNGFVSAESCQDYCTSFWRHDIYTGNSTPNPGLNLFFKRDTDFRKVSWNGYEHNVLFLNQGDGAGGRRFLNVAHLWGVAFEYDARAVVATDLDNDGLPDLVIEERNNLSAKRFLHVYRNQWKTASHWVGLRLEESAGGAPLPTAQITVSAGGVKRIGAVVNGDSFLCQHPPSYHTGLGDTAAVDWIEVRWGDGQVTRVDKPAVDQWHRVSAPAFKKP
jgi:enediyne biosynthesis protein E4